MIKREKARAWCKVNMSLSGARVLLVVVVVWGMSSLSSISILSLG